MGIDEKRAREVFQEMNLQVRKEYTQEAAEIANSRLQQFEDSLMQKMEQVEGALEAFSDPSFQMLIVEAQKSAASTERLADYDLLSELLIHRFKKDDNRVARAGINVAVDIVDQISDDALLGLTVFHAVGQFAPISKYASDGLNILDELFGKIIYSDLPTGQEWLDHLDILRAVRQNPYGTIYSIRQIFAEKMSGFVDVGIKINSENHIKAKAILQEIGLSDDLLVEHCFNKEYVRLGVANKRHIEELFVIKDVTICDQIVKLPQKLTQQELSALESIYSLYSQENNVREQNINTLMAELEKRPNLKALNDWWDKIPFLISLTSAGKVLAHSNAQRCDNSLPELA